jgi:hypothetical protein
MKKIALTAMAIAALGVGACQRTGGNNSAHNNSVAADHGANTSEDHADGNASTVVENTLSSAGNGLSKAGDVIENTAGDAVNEVREIGGSDRETSNNSSR